MQQLPYRICGAWPDIWLAKNVNNEEGPLAPDSVTSGYLPRRSCEHSCPPSSSLRVLCPTSTANGWPSSKPP